MGRNDLTAVASKLLTVQKQTRQEQQLRFYRPVSDKAMELHVSTDPVVGLGGGNRCEAAGSRVVTDRGMIPIEEVRRGDRVPGHGRGWRHVIDTYRSPDPVPVYEVVTKRGLRFVGSAEHMSLVCGQRRREWHRASDANWKDATWRQLSELEGSSLDDWLFIAVRGNGGWPDWCQISSEDAYFLGLLVGDGSYNATGYLRGTCTISCDDQDPEISDWICVYLLEKGVNPRPIHRNGAVHVHWSNVEFWDWLKSVGLVKARGQNKQIPESVWRGTRDVVASFLRGLFDSDGCATTKPSVVFINTSESVARGAQIMLKRLGIKSSLRIQRANTDYKRVTESWRLEASGSSTAVYREEVGFLTRRKAERLPSRKCPSSPSHYGWDRIRSVERVGEKVVYGLTIEGKPEYYSNGFLQHNSSKTESCLAEIAMCATGVFPVSVQQRLEALDQESGDETGTRLAKKFRGPINARVVCESLTTTLHQTILPKLQWWKWTGVDQPGGDKGHWGWIPRDCLVAGQWERSWSEKYRVLRILCRDPNNYAKVVGESTIEFFSHDQDPSDFASGQCHIVLHDEPPRYAIWRENEARTISVSGRMLLAMTWPDDPAIPVDWIFDKVYEPAQMPDSGIRWINLWTTENPYVDQQAVSAQAARWDHRTEQVRIYGRPIRFSNRIHPLFTDQEDWWCFGCGSDILPESFTPPTCGKCHGTDVVTFNHVRDFETIPYLPTVFVLDPHPRKPHMYLWAQIDPSDDVWVVACGEMNGEPLLVRDDVRRIEADLHLDVRRRLIDPNMGRSPSSATRREATWQDEFDSVGIVTDLADDSDVGRARINERLRPDPDTREPRIHIHPRCSRVIHQMKRYVWGEYRGNIDKDLKQKPKEKEDDDPTMLKYLLNSDPTFRSLSQNQGIFRRREATLGRQRREGVWRM